MTDAQSQPEGVVGYGPDDRPIYDGDWFDRQMAKLGPGITVTVTGVEPIRQRLDGLPGTIRKALREALDRATRK